MYVQGIQKYFLWKTFVHLLPLLALHIICLDFRNTVPNICWEINCNIDIFIFQDNIEEAIAMSASSNAFKASRTEDNDNHAAVANIKGQYLLLYIQRMSCNPACAHVPLQRFIALRWLHFLIGHPDNPKTLKKSQNSLQEPSKSPTSF